jgi:hypothetical protein
MQIIYINFYKEMQKNDYNLLGFISLQELQTVELALELTRNEDISNYISPKWSSLFKLLFLNFQKFNN